jgi:hypothetical protein
MGDENQKSEYGPKVFLERNTQTGGRKAGIRKKMKLVLERQGCQRVFDIA